MKIEVEIPDELIGKKVLWLFAGAEHIAVKRPEDGWVIKDGRCSMCGACCKKGHIENLGLPMRGVNCAYLVPHPKEDGKLVCKWGGNRPFLCGISTARFVPRCTVTWKEADET